MGLSENEKVFMRIKNECQNVITGYALHHLESDLINIPWRRATVERSLEDYSLSAIEITVECHIPSDGEELEQAFFYDFDHGYEYMSLALGSFSHLNSVEFKGAVVYHHLVEVLNLWWKHEGRDQVIKEFMDQ